MKTTSAYSSLANILHSLLLSLFFTYPEFHFFLTVKKKVVKELFGNDLMDKVYSLNSNEKKGEIKLEEWHIYTKTFFDPFGSLPTVPLPQDVDAQIKRSFPLGAITNNKGVEVPIVVQPLFNSKIIHLPVDKKVPLKVNWYRWSPNKNDYLNKSLQLQIHTKVTQNNLKEEEWYLVSQPLLSINVPQEDYCAHSDSCRNLPLYGVLGGVPFFKIFCFLFRFFSSF